MSHGIENARHLFIAVIVATSLLGSFAAAQTRASSACNVQITSPRSDETVAAAGSVEGIAQNLPAGKHLWVFARRSGLAIWWPESGDEIVPKRDEKWKAFVTYGEPRDAGTEFDITAAVVDDQANQDLHNWFDAANKTGRYPGIRLPHSECAVKVVTVNRGP